MADQVLYSGVACISDLIVKEGLINLDFADVLSVMREKGKAMMGRGEASGDKRVLNAAIAAISNPLIENPSIKRASGLIISITGGKDLMLFEVEEAATRIREEVDEDANIIVGATFDESLDGIVRVSVVATGIDNPVATREVQPVSPLAELAARLRNDNRRAAERIERSAPRPQLRGPAIHPTPRPPEELPAKSIAERARHPAPRSLDAFGRIAAVQHSIEQAVLDIPAFISRRAN
jgi:cell division protein FtsZ